MYFNVHIYIYRERDISIYRSIYRYIYLYLDIDLYLDLYLDIDRYFFVFLCYLREEGTKTCYQLDFE